MIFTKIKYNNKFRNILVLITGVSYQVLKFLLKNTVFYISVIKGTAIYMTPNKKKIKFKRVNRLRILGIILDKSFTFKEHWLLEHNKVLNL